MAAPCEIGHDAAFEPFGMVEGGRSTGMLLDIVAAALDRAGIAFRFVALPLDAAEQALLDGRVAALAFKGDTPERRAIFDFSGPLVMSGAAFFVPAGKPVPASLADLAGQRVVTPRRGPLAAMVERAKPAVTLVPAASYAESLACVLEGRADAAALNLQAGLRMARNRHPGAFALPEAPFLPVPLAFAVAKGRNAELLAAVDRHVASMRADGSFAAIEARWLGR